MIELELSDCRKQLQYALEQLAAAQANEDHRQRMIAAVRATAKLVHPEYGDCDALGEGGSCFECLRRFAALQRDRDRMRDALVTYGHHRTLCAVVGGYDTPCDCGFSAALDEPEAGNCVIGSYDLDGEPRCKNCGTCWRKDLLEPPTCKQPEAGEKEGSDDGR